MELGRGPRLGFLNSALRPRGHLAEPEAPVAPLVFVEVGRGGSKRGFPSPCAPCLRRGRHGLGICAMADLRQMCFPSRPWRSLSVENTEQPASDETRRQTVSWEATALTAGTVGLLKIKGHHPENDQIGGQVIKYVQ